MDIILNFENLETEENLGPEPQEGNIEYKLRLHGISKWRFEKFKTQLKWRVGEGHGYAIYHIGVEDKGIPYGISKENIKDSLIIFKRASKDLKCDMSIEYIKKGLIPKCFCAKIFVSNLEVSERSVSKF
jgi:GTPase